MNPLFDLTGQVALVTGASRGLGQYLGRALAKSGADLIVTARKKEDCAEFTAEIEGLGRKVKYAQFLHDASEVHWLDPDAEVDSNIGVAVGDGILTLELPVLKPDVVSPVVELFLKD